MLCEEVQAKLDSHTPDRSSVDGLQQHLNSCEDCRSFCDDLEFVEKAMSHIPAETISPRASQRIRNSVAAMVVADARVDEQVVETLKSMPMVAISSQASQSIHNSVRMAIEERTAQMNRENTIAAQALASIPEESISANASQRIRNSMRLMIEERTAQMSCDEQTVARALAAIPQETISPQASQRIHNSVAMMIEARSAEMAREEEIATSALASIPQETISPQASIRIRNSIAMMIAEKEKEARRAPIVEQAPGFFEKIAAFFSFEGAAQTAAMCAVTAFAFYTYNFDVNPGLRVAPANPGQATGEVVAFAPREATNVTLMRGRILVGGLIFTADGSEGKTIPVPENETISTLGSDEAHLQMADGVRVAMSSSTQVSVSEHSLSVRTGETGVHVPKGSPQGFTVQTAFSEAVILGTRVLVNNSGRVDLLEGHVRVTSRETGIGIEPAPGQAVVPEAAAGTLGLKASGEFRLRFMYQMFGRLDSMDQIARDVKVSPIQLAALVDSGKAHTSLKTVKPTTYLASLNVDPQVLRVARATENPPSTVVPAVGPIGNHTSGGPTGIIESVVDGSKINLLGTQSRD